MHYATVSVGKLPQQPNTCLLNDIGAEFLNRKSAYVACKLADNTIAEAVVVQVQDVLHDLKVSVVSNSVS
jgi:hypothetical protein